MNEPKPNSGPEGTPSIMRPPNKLKAKATNNGQIQGSGFDPDLLKRAEARADNMMGDFLAAADADIERLILASEKAYKDVENRAEHLQAVERVAHEIKGYGSNIGYQLLTQFCSSLSMFIRKAEVDDDIKVQVTRAHVDAIRLVFFNQLTGDGGETGAKLSEGLSQTLMKFVKEF
jgi:HPt (histidine-containing phosphotransfer) domain-containing protein